MSNRRGMQKIEFYTSLNEIKELYDQGYVVLKILYEEMKKRRNWEMSYWSFCKYAKEELPLKKSIKKEVKPVIQKKKVTMMVQKLLEQVFQKLLNLIHIREI